MIYVARSSTSRWLPSHSLSLFPRHDLLLKLSKLVSVARVIYLRLNEIECRLNSPRPDNSHNFIRRQAGQRERDRGAAGQNDWRADRACFDICIDLYIHIDKANRFLLAVEWEKGIFLNCEFWISEIIMLVDKSPKFRWPLPSATAQLALGLVINLNLIFLTAI